MFTLAVCCLTVDGTPARCDRNDVDVVYRVASGWDTYDDVTTAGCRADLTAESLARLAPRIFFGRPRSNKPPVYPVGVPYQRDFTLPLHRPGDSPAGHSSTVVVRCAAFGCPTRVPPMAVPTRPNQRGRRFAFSGRLPRLTWAVVPTLAPGGPNGALRRSPSIPVAFRGCRRLASPTIHAEHSGDPG